MRRTAALVLAALAVSLGTVGAAWAITGGELDGTAPERRDDRLLPARRAVPLLGDARLADGARHGRALHGGRARQDDRDIRHRRAQPIAARGGRHGQRACRRPDTTAPVPGWLTGTPHANPLFDGKLQLNNLHDVGVVVLDEPYTGDACGAAAGELPRRAVARARAGSTSRRSRSSATACSSRSRRRARRSPATSRATTAPAASPRRSGRIVSSQVLKLAENAKDSRAGRRQLLRRLGRPGVPRRPARRRHELSAQASSAGALARYYRLDTADARSFLDELRRRPLARDAPARSGPLRQERNPLPLDLRPAARAHP